MSIAALSIDLDARLAGLQAGLDKAGALAAKQAAQIERAFGGASTALATMGATLGTALSAAGITAFVRSTVDGLAKLNDLAVATGASVENLSALEDAAVRTGTSVDTMADALVKMNKALSDAKPGTDQAAAFKALGLSVEELKRIDPVQAFQRLAQALASYADDGNKARLTQELFGKSLRDVAPLLKDVAERGELVAGVTKEQADEAKRFNDQLAALQKNSIDLARAITSQLLPAMNSYLEKLARARSSGADIFGKEIISEVQSARLRLAVSLVEDLQVALEKSPGNRGISEALTRARADADALLKSATGANDKLKALVGLSSLATGPEQSKSAFLRGDKDTTPVARPSIGDPFGGDKAKAGKKGKEPWDLNAWLADTQKAIDIAFIDAGEKAREADDRNRERRVQSLADMTEELKQGNLRLTAELIEDDKARARALIILDEQVLMKKLDSLEVYGQAYEDAQAAIKEKTALALRDVDQMKQKGDETGQQLALVFSSAAGQAITQWQGFSNLLKGILADIGQIAIKKVLIEPLQNYLNSALSGFNFASLLGAANGRAFAAGGGVVPFASGGIVSSPTLFRFAGGTGLMGEAGPEAIMPLKRGRGGKLGVAAGSGGVVIYQTLNVGAGASRNEVAAAMVAAKKAAVAEVYDAARRGRAIA